jgi:hypothetical protein
MKMKSKFTTICAAAGLALLFAMATPAAPNGPNGTPGKAESASSQPAAAPTPIDHPEIRKALAALQNARADVARAVPDYKGHRAQALKAIDEAISQLNICLTY